MGRKPRLWDPNFYYHVVCRGNRRDALFRDDGDFLNMLHILRLLHKQNPFEVTSYCFMTNHYHLQLRSQEQPISKIMALMNKRYADYYNTKYGITGHVFEKRYYDKVILNMEGMLGVSSYIHINPVEAKMVKSPEKYRWSSYCFYQETDSERERPPYLNSQVLLDYFPGTVTEKKRMYGEYIKSYQEQSPSPSNRQNSGGDRHLTTKIGK